MGVGLSDRAPQDCPCQRALRRRSSQPEGGIGSSLQGRVRANRTEMKRPLSRTQLPRAIGRKEEYGTTQIGRTDKGWWRNPLWRSSHPPSPKLKMCQLTHVYTCRTRLSQLSIEHHDHLIRNSRRRPCPSIVVSATGPRLSEAR